MKKDESPAPWVRQFGLLGVVVASLVGYTGGGFGLGYLAHRYWGTPILIAVFTSLAGFVLAMYRVYKMFEKDME